MEDKNNNAEDGIERRNVLKAFGTTAGAASVYSGLSANGLATEGKTTADSDIEVVDTTLESGASVSTVSSKSTLDSQTQKLVDFIEQDSGLTGVTDVNLSINVETNDEDFNSYDPAVDIIPFGNNKRDANQNGRSPRQGGGLLFVYTVVEDGGRVPVGTFGMTSMSVGARNQNSSTKADKRQVTSYALKDGEPVRAETQVVEGLQSNNGDVSTQVISVVCASCQALVDSVCVGGSRVLGKYGCTAACSAAFGANFIAIFGCASICSTMFTAISAVGCTAAGSAICKEMTDLTPSYITFC